MGDQKSVEGIRHPARTPLGVAFGIFGILCLLSPLWWIVELIRHASYRFNEGFIGSLGWSIVFFILFVVGVLAADGGLSKKNILESDCPCCGAHAKRRFWDLMPTECGACIAYLRADADRVREESLDQTESCGNPYTVAPKRYLPAAKRDQFGRVNFQMPPICAICGSTEISETTEVDVTSPPSSSGPSWLGMAIVATSSGSTRRKMGLRYDGTVRSSGPPSPTDEDQRREEFANVRVPVCNKHTGGTKPLKCSGVALEFASYRYYKEFLALNGIDAPDAKS